MSEPTAPSQRALTREESAKIELGQTRAPVAVQWALTLGLLLTAAGIPIWQHVRDVRQNLADWERAPSGERSWSALLPQVYEIVRLAPDWGKIRQAETWWGAFAVLPSVGEISRFEQSVEDNSVLSGIVQPRVQSLLIRYGGAGNEEVITGSEGWLFYKPAMQYVTGKPFLDPGRLGALSRHSGVQPDPVVALARFRNQLADRGIHLVVMPTPGKAQVHPEMLVSMQEPPAAAFQNPSHDEFLRKMEAANITVFDPAPILMESARGPDAAYLETDTHWTPQAMQKVAAALADFLREIADLPAARPDAFSRSAVEARGEGDIAAMLRLPEGQALYPQQSVTINRVLGEDGGFWRPDVASPVLLMGDSFTNIYSAPDLRWGEHAGLAEQLSSELGFAVDRIAINAGGSHTTREQLASQLRRHYADYDARGAVSDRERLADKRVVVYQFASRELLLGDWKIVDLPVARPEAFGTAGAAASDTATEWAQVRGRVGDISRPPRPGSVPYREAVIAVHLLEARLVQGSAEISPEGMLVYVMGMTDNQHTAAAALQQGAEVTLRIQPWADVEGRFGSLQKLDLGADADLLFPAWWGEILPQ